ncbi:MAG: hypothetical protein IM531_17150 [Pseudanabaena sp. M090S1SP1A06QC]|nr:hypothetical protein [Pseudanabaena sp. M172S2SP2A07QC]MCA6521351.1 hypothetical protein [Pseudanabaena sp. M051S1SP2A07QC]MCA6527683.1 hypothetical protein [Pseudanabaena sp. M179S2SP2A07QC]MCA6534903.1 hypothetical protein [Pseudanabaena sp. M176S2SP2A07QC]MCA6562209.1 hypothetical protein [Pseudanabaena sp. M079S1SP2A07QC]MCA6577860.1 hypothetical protein [Pseudanabaena sp. M085S1SP2A07QC]MCA6616359.1 hypothetical protein [Pseudanabaena sp. M090S1SP1A06QC]
MGALHFINAPYGDGDRTIIHPSARIAIAIVMNDLDVLRVSCATPLANTRKKWMCIKSFPLLRSQLKCYVNNAKQ